MRFYNIDTQGKLWLDRRAALPGWAAGDEGRIVYDESGEEIFYGDAAAWIRMYSTNNLAQLIIDIDAVGAWIRKDQNDLTAFQLTVQGGVIGDVEADDGNSIVSSGATRLASNVQVGTVKAPDGNDVLIMNSVTDASGRLGSMSDGATGVTELLFLQDTATAWARLKTVKATNGTDVLVTNTTVANSTFTGISERARYA